MNWRALIHWRKAWLVRRAARRLPEYDIPWAVITPYHVGTGVKGWDYHLIRREWGYRVALRYQAEHGGWILELGHG